MKRVWIVEDAVPAQALGYIPPMITNEGVRYLLNRHDAVWEEQEVKELCDSLSGDAFELTVLLSPGQLTQLLQSGAEPPHVVIFDWEGPGFDERVNTEAIRSVLESSFSFIQVYTHLGVAAVEPKIEDLRAQFADRMLPAKSKQDVNATGLSAIVETAWNETIAGEVADRVRAKTRIAIERVLIDLCSVKRTALTALLGPLDGGLDTLLMAKLRDEIGFQEIDQLSDMFQGGGQVETNDDLQRFQSIFYYHFPADDLVRTGDIVITETGSFAMVFSPQCHLQRFRKKTGGRLTLVEAEVLTSAGIAALRDSGVTLSEIGWSAVANHKGAGYSVVVLPNVPKVPNSRHILVDIVLRTHAWHTLYVDKTEGEPLQYADVSDTNRLCTITETCSGAIVSHIAAVMASAGVPDFPEFERNRINEILRT